MQSVLKTLTIEYGNRDAVATLFGVILYTDAHPNIKKVLRDEDYWLSFDEISGERFCVFSIRPRQGRHKFPSFPPGTIGMMVPIWEEPSENRSLLELFELKDTSELPLLLLFAEVDGKYLTINLPLKDGSVDDARQSIAEKLKISRVTLDQIHEDNIKNSEGLFAAVSLQVETNRKWEILSKGLNIYKTLKDIIP